MRAATPRRYGACTPGIFDEGFAMSIDDLLIAIIIGGALLSGAYLRAQYAMRRRHRNTERRRESRLRELYASLHMSANGH
jgi:hypothetical protein